MRSRANTKRFFISLLLAFVIIWSILGYPLIAGLTALIGTDNNIVSIAFRAITAVCAGLLILALPRGRLALPLLLFALFWLAYLLRLVVSLHFETYPLSRPVQDYWLWAVGACLCPALATLRAAEPRTAIMLRMPMLLIAIIAILLTLSQGSTAFVQATGQSTDIDRWNLASLNPISAGHLGVSGVLLGIGVLMTPSRGRLETLLAVGAVPSGLLLVALANSRGPVVALAFCISMLLLASARNFRIQLMAFTGLAVVACLAILAPDVFLMLDPLTNRFSAIKSGNDLSVIGRTIAFQGAIDQFLGAPLFGDGIEERRTGYYPHNLVLEAFMSTGIIGGIPFMLLLLLSLRGSWQMFRRAGTEIWVGLLAVQFIVAAQFSGSMYLSTALWVTVPLSIVVARQFRWRGYRA